ncbi:MAG: hypothetical protein RL217_1871 [Pseudomonadota bacterium]|jgi:hemolysin activation/secretion protein
MALCSYRHATLSALGLTLLAAQAVALDIPDAGQTLRTIEQPAPELPAQPKLDLVKPQPSAPSSAAQDEAALRLKVSQIQITGNTVLSSEQLLAVLAPLTGQELTLAQLQQAARSLSDYYHQQGYFLAYAYLPQQEIKQGTVQITILEGQYGSVQVNNTAQLKEAALAPLQAVQSQAVVKQQSLEQTLLTLNELNGVIVQSALAPGKALGSTDLSVNIQSARAFSGELSVDNYGNYYTGQYRLNGNVQWHNPLGLGDKLDARVLSSNESQFYGRLAWSSQWGRWGTQTGLAYSWMQYQLAEDFSALDADGQAQVSSLWLTQPVLRRRAGSLFVTAQLEQKDFNEDIKLFDQNSKKTSQVLSLGLSGTRADSWQGVSSFALNWRYGDLDLRTATQQQLDAQTAKAQGSFSAITANLTRLQSLAPAWSVLARLDGQWANKNLDGSEKFSLGGVYGVHAYPQSEASGDVGFLMHAALRYAWRPDLQLSTFMDYGQVKMTKNPWASGKNHEDLSGTGVGFDWHKYGWQVQSSLAWKLGGTDASSAPDKDVRLWLKLGYQF